MGDPVAPLLPPEDLASQLSSIEVLLSIYSGSSDLVQTSNHQGKDDEESLEEDDIVLTSDNYTAIRNLAHFLSLSLGELGQPQSVSIRDALPAIIEIGIKVDPLRGTLMESDQKAQHRCLLLTAGFVVRRMHMGYDDVLEPKWSLKHADWMDRAAYDSLCQSATSIKWESEESVGYIMNVIEAISEASLEYFSNDDESKIEVRPSQTSTDVTSTSSAFVLRTWHLFPSLSMKEKRKDLVSFATRSNLTGFVLAGKPGLVALECPMQDDSESSAAQSTSIIDAYWSDIKTNSWSDLPPGHKKVSEKHREFHVQRCFTNMQDISDEIGGTTDVIESGRVRRNDLDKVKGWLQSHGCVGQLEIVLGKD